jgi:hypothetical protein
MSRVTVDRAAPPVPVSVIIGRKDESVPFDDVQRVWISWQSSGELSEGSRFIEIADGDHGLVDHVGLIAREIVRTSAILSKNP